MRLSKPFIKLPFSFDAEKLTEEIEGFSPNDWIAHPNGFKGNSAVALVSKGAGDNNHFHGRMQATRHLERSAYHQQVLASFNEVLGRSRLMRLEGGCEVASHIDLNYHWHTRVRIHIPVITNPNVIFYCDHEQIKMKAGECWIFDSWRQHRVVNSSPHTRIHLVIDTSGSSRFWKMVQEMEQLEAQHGPDAINNQITHIPFEDGKTVHVRTERYNVSPVITPGEMDALIEDLVRDFDGKPSNDPKLVESYKQILGDFAKDWRVVWHNHGHNHSGEQHFRSLAKKMRERLHPDRRALTLKSNNAGVNVAIVKRLLECAINSDVREELV